MVDAPAKPMYMSKTIWVNVVMAVVAIIAAWVPKAAEIVNEEAVLMVFALINVLMRLISKDKVVLW